MRHFAFLSLYRHGFARVAACVTPSAVADPTRNADAILDAARRCHERSVAVAVFTELALSGYAIEDLRLQDTLLDAVEEAVARLVVESTDLMPALVVGAPLRCGARIYNAACVIHRGRLLGVVPKTYLPNYREFYEGRHFASGAILPGETIRVGGLHAPFGTDLVFSAEDVPGLTIGVEICEDMWVPAPPVADAALAGATVLLNLSGSPITIGRARARALLCQAHSMRYLAAYVYAAGGAGESTTDLAWDGHTCIYENGVLLADGERFADGGQVTIADVDLDLLRLERAAMGSFDDNRRVQVGTAPFRSVSFHLGPPRDDVGFERTVERFPFVPADPSRLEQDCFEAYNIQVAGLEQRLRATATKRVTIGVSGGLDSTQALIVAAKAFDRLGLPRSGILAYTMPGFGTGESSREYAHRLMRALGVTAQELDIKPTARLMLETMEHPAGRGEGPYDTTYENVQAGLRTDYLFRLANMHGAIVVGTGDLSELALGWCTYGVGDQMSHYNVNAGVPKTLIQHLIRWVVSTGQFDVDVSETLSAIVAAEISPELIPAEAGKPVQSTEASVGPYELQDFNLFYVLRYGMKPSRIAFLAERAWGNAAAGAWPPGFPAERRREYDRDTVVHWLEVFLRRFFAFAQFKRSAMPNGPKVTAGGSLSPRGDWRAPSDGNAEIWLRELRSALADAAHRKPE